MANNVYKKSGALKINIDEKDKQILKPLMENARLSVAEIVHKTTIPRDTVSYRLKRMEEGGLITHYHTLVDPELLGYNYFSIVLLKLEPLPESELTNFQFKLQKMGNITHINKTIGQYDMVLYIVAKDAINFGEIINEIKSANTPTGKKIISNIDTLNIIHELKVDNFSGLI
jgi:DNA-binding Lrp family transcriptional regulator